MKKKQKLLLKLLHSRTEANMCLFFFYEWFWEKRFLFLLWFISNLVVWIEKLTVGIYACSFSLTQVMTEQPHGNPKKVYSRISLFSQNNDYKWNGIIRKLVQQLHHEKDSDTYWSKNVIGKMWSKVLKRKKKKHCSDCVQGIWTGASSSPALQMEPASLSRYFRNQNMTLDVLPSKSPP